MGSSLDQEVENFFYREADYLDERLYRDWLQMLHDDLEYSVPIGRNVHSGETVQEYTRPGSDVLWFDEGKETLAKRIAQLETGEHWAEEPVSRVTHLVTNIRIQSTVGELTNVSSRFLISRNRVDTESDLLVGRRVDTLQRVDGTLLLRKRIAYLNQSVLLAKNLTMFF